MNIDQKKEELKRIIRKELDIIPFLKNLTKKERIQLRPFVKELKDKVFEQRQFVVKMHWGETYKFEETHTKKQRDLILKACFVCYTKKEAKSGFLVTHWINQDYIDHMLSWYVPTWYNALVNEQFPWLLDYFMAIQLQEKGYIQMSDNMVVSLLPRVLIDMVHENNKYVSYYRPKRLHRYPITLEEHFWVLFEYEETLWLNIDGSNFKNLSAKKDVWIYTIINLLEEGKLDRDRLLRATIQTATKGFNRNASNWYFKLLDALKPTKKEILELHEDFMAALHSPHSKVIGVVLKYFKTVANLVNFQSASFVQMAPQLLSSTTKSIVHSTLMILAKIAKANKDMQSEICKVSAQALIHVDEKIQLRAAKLLTTFGDVEDEDLKNEVSVYQDDLLHSTKLELEHFIETASEETDESFEIEKANPLSEDLRIPNYETFDEMLFLVNQVIDNNESYHLDLSLKYLPKLQRQMSAQNATKLIPLLKRCCRRLSAFEWISRIGNLEHMMAGHLMKFGLTLVQQYPDEMKDFTVNLKETYQELVEQGRYKYSYKDFLKSVGNPPIYGKVYTIYKELMAYSEYIRLNNKKVELLSSPTHEPCWVDPMILVKRLRVYEEVNEAYNLIDFQVAFGRIPTATSSPELLEEISSIRDNEVKMILQYHFNLIELMDCKIKHPERWLQTLLKKRNPDDLSYFRNQTGSNLKLELADYSWICESRHYPESIYDYSARKYVTKQVEKTKIKLQEFRPNASVSSKAVKSILGFFKNKKSGIIPSLYNRMEFKVQRYESSVVQPHDEIKFLYLAPSNPSVLMAQLIYHHMLESNLFTTTKKRNMVNLLKGFYLIWNEHRPVDMTYLFLGIGFLCDDKIARELAAEIWYHSVEQDTIHSHQFGQVLGKLQADGFAPMKRFTDNIMANMFNLSKSHNRHLFQLLDGMIGNMNKPIRGVKKLVEIYCEMLHKFSDLTMGSSTRDRLESWKSVKSLKPLITKAFH